MEIMVWILVGLVVVLLIAVILLARRPSQSMDVKQVADYVIGLAQQQLKMVTQEGKSDLDSKKQLIDQQLQSVSNELGKVKDMLQKVENERATSFTALAEQIKKVGERAVELTAATSTLREALASPQSRGQWGERIADDILRLAGFIEGVNYARQLGVEGGTARPDYVFYLPKGLCLNMDCKFPLNNYMKSLETNNDTERNGYEQAFLRDVRNRIKEIANRDYINPEGGTLTFVILFIPNESIYSFIHKTDPSLLDYAIKNNVVCCSPFTLFAVLAIIRQAVDNFAVQKESNEILMQLGRFKSEWDKFMDLFDKLGQRIYKLQSTYEELVGARRRKLERPLERLDYLRQGRGLEIVGEVISEEVEN